MNSVDFIELPSNDGQTSMSIIIYLTFYTNHGWSTLRAGKDHINDLPQQPATVY